VTQRSSKHYSNSGQEHTWQFRIDERRAQSALDGYSHFRDEAELHAAKLSLHVVAIKSVCLAYSRGRVLLVVGTAKLVPNKMMLNEYSEQLPT
jgi:hypothetical protein